MRYHDAPDVRDVGRVLVSATSQVTVSPVGGEGAADALHGGHQLGIPPTAEALLYGVMLLQKKIRRTGTIER